MRTRTSRPLSEVSHFGGDIGARALFPERAQIIGTVYPLAGEKPLEDAPTRWAIQLIRHVSIFAPDGICIDPVCRWRCRQRRQVEVKQQRKIAIAGLEILRVFRGVDIVLDFVDYIVRKAQQSQPPAGESGALFLIVALPRIINDIVKEYCHCHRIAIDNCLAMVVQLTQKRSDVFSRVILPVWLGIGSQELIQQCLCA